MKTLMMWHMARPQKIANSSHKVNQKTPTYCQHHKNKSAPTQVSLRHVTFERKQPAGNSVT